MIGIYRREKLSMWQIALKSGRSPSSTSRELKRNVRPNGHLTTSVAHEKSRARLR
jgi:IS30 family transposase